MGKRADRAFLCDIVGLGSHVSEESCSFGRSCMISERKKGEKINIYA